MAFLIGAQAEWLFRDNAGNPLISGWIFTYRNVQRNEFKAIYQDAAGLIPYANGQQLTGAGTLGPIYWEDDEPYYIVISKSANEDHTEPVDIVKTFSDYAPGTGGGPPVTTSIDIKNFVINGQFRYNFGNKSKVELEGIVGNSRVAIAEGEWEFDKSGDTSATDELNFVAFPLGSTEAENNPPFYCEYRCTAIGAATETVKIIAFNIKDVNTFSNIEVTFSFYARSDQNSAVTVDIRQYFGTGGSPSTDVNTQILSQTLTSSWVKYNGTITIPSTSGKTLGTDDNDVLAIIINIPINSISHIAFINTQLERGNKISPYEYETAYETARRGRAYLIPPIGDTDEGRVLTVARPYPPYLLPNNAMLAWSGGFCPMGSMMDWPSEIAPDGWWECDGRDILRYQHPLLYVIFSHNHLDPPIWGRTQETSLHAAPAAAVVTVTTDINAAVTDAVDIDTGFTIIVTQQGSATQPEITTVTCLPGVSISAGARFYINTVTNEYVPWYRKDGGGTEPTDVGKIPVRIDINGTDSATEVALKTAEALNYITFKIPDFRGLFPRYWDHGQGVDPDAASRTAVGPGSPTGDHVGTAQSSENLSHAHSHAHGINLPTDFRGGGSNPTAQLPGAPLEYYGNTDTDATPSGGSESRPINSYLMKIIKY